MAYVFCLADGQRVVPPASMCAEWLAALHPTDAPQDRWVAVPSHLLPPGVLAYFNGYQFVAAHFGAMRGSGGVTLGEDPRPGSNSAAQPTPFAGRGRRLGD
jgi:hypothetical protein